MSINVELTNKECPHCKSKLYLVDDRENDEYFYECHECGYESFN